MKFFYLLCIILVVCIWVVSWRSNRKIILFFMHGFLLLIIGVIYFSPTDLYLRELDLGEAKAYFYYRDTPLPEDGSLIVKIAPNDGFYYSGEYVLQSGYYWHGQLQIEILPVDEEAFIIKELHRPTKWHINRNGDLSKIE